MPYLLAHDEIGKYSIDIIVILAQTNGFFLQSFGENIYIANSDFDLQSCFL